MITFFNIFIKKYESRENLLNKANNYFENDSDQQENKLSNTNEVNKSSYFLFKCMYFFRKQKRIVDCFEKSSKLA